MISCCSRFAEAVDKNSGEFERDEAGRWNIGGCCGGGCYVVEDMRFCPFCGTEISPKSENIPRAYVEGNPAID
jgi:hypothetical protein